MSSSDRKDKPTRVSNLDTFLPSEPKYTPYPDEPTFTPIEATIEEGITCANMKSAQKLEKYVTEVNAWMKWAREKIKQQEMSSDLDQATYYIKTLLSKYLTEFYGERCPDYDGDCECCKRWECFDIIFNEGVS